MKGQVHVQQTLTGHWTSSDMGMPSLGKHQSDLSRHRVECCHDTGLVRRRQHEILVVRVKAELSTRGIPYRNAEANIAVHDQTRPVAARILLDSLNSRVRELDHGELLNWSKLVVFSGFDTMPGCAMSSSFSFI